MTLREMIEQHPEWADLDIVVYSVDGDYEYVGASASVYEDIDRDDESGNAPKVLVFATGN